MELFKVFNNKEIEKINAITPIEDKDYSNDEINRLEHLIFEDIMSKCKNERKRKPKI